MEAGRHGVPRGPARRNRLGPGVELDTFHTVDVQIAEERLLPATERGKGHGHRDGDIDAHHPDFISFSKRRAAPPEFVKIAVPLPYGFLLTSAIACSSVSTRRTTRTGPKISSR